MFEHDLGSADGHLSPSEIQQIEQEAQQYSVEYGLTPEETYILEEQIATVDSLPPAEAQAYEQEVVSQEEAQAQQTMDTTMQQAESFDQTLISGN